ncbi:MAG: RusA family crossover junction endodeoxyribonuclease [Candidatus Marinimicrobia bacterium]|nr:RusA family crossover junction endodeoxyribonuclease [Candidatus Neomarinimicrobiota bacterium]
MLNLILPYPPSVNQYYRMWRGRIVKSPKGTSYAKDVAYYCRNEGIRVELDCRLKVDILVFPPDNRRRDLDNVLKAILDSLEDAKVFKDDSLIDDLRVRRMDTFKDGKIEIGIEIIEL